MTTGQRITDEEAAILRAWLGGAMLTEIAKARRCEPGVIARVVVDTCGTDRAVARDWLGGGPRPEGVRRPAPAAPIEIQHAEPVPPRPEPRVTAVLNAARALTAALCQPGVTWYRAPWGEMTDVMRAVDQLDGAGPAVANVPTQAVDVLEQWFIHRCADCRYLGPAQEHTTCAGELQPVVLLAIADRTES